MFLGILVLITALTISSVAIYYSVAGLVAIFAAASIPIMIMGGALEIGKLVTAVWLHRYWREARWWLKAYLSTAVLVLMFITSMGIFGFLSKAHIEQTASAQEGIAQITRIDSEVIRLEEIIKRAESRITDAEASVGKGNDAIQSQIDKEQERIDNAYIRIQPAIDEQISIIEETRKADSKRTEPYEQQLTALEDELRKINEQATEYEERIANLTPDNQPVERLLEQISKIEENIIVTTNKLQSTERDQIRAAQAIIGVTSDGLFGGNTRRALATWVAAQQERISELQSQAADLRQQAQDSVNVERDRLTKIIDDLRNVQTPAIKKRQLEILETIDDVRKTESPAIQRARDEIARIRAGADAQILQSNKLIQSLRDNLIVGKDQDIENLINEQRQIIVDANNSIDTLTQQKYALQAEYRKLEAEVGPIKYLAEFIYGETANQTILEDAVRWVIITIIFVFDPLAVLLLIASQATFEMRRQEYPRPKAQQEIKDDYIDRFDDGWDDWKAEYARTYTSGTDSNNIEIPQTWNDSGTDADDNRHIRTTDDRGVLPEGILGPEQEARRQDLEEKEQDEKYQDAKKAWKLENPDKTLKQQKERYINGIIDSLPWEDKKYNKTNE